MKKSMFLMCAVLLLFGCSPQENKDVSVSGTSTVQTDTEPPSAELETAAEATETEAPTESETEPNIPIIHNKTEEYPRAAELNIAAPSKNDLLRKRKCIFFADGGYYYYTNIGGRASANDVLSFDNGDGNALAIENGEDCTWCFYDGNAFYGSRRAWDNQDGKKGMRSSICKYENGIVSDLMDFEIDKHPVICYDENYIYYYPGKDSSEKSIYRMDYDCENKELVLEDYGGRSFTVHENNLYYYKEQEDVCCVYSMDSGETIMLEDGGIGRVNGDYMYYLCSYNSVTKKGNKKYKDCLMRMNLDDYKIELVCENVFTFDFYEDVILYVPYHKDKEDFSGRIYKLENGESEEIFSTQDILGDNYFDIDCIQCGSGRIFLGISCGPFYSHIEEIDIYGDSIGTYYDSKW